METTRGRNIRRLVLFATVAGVLAPATASSAPSVQATFLLSPTAGGLEARLAVSSAPGAICTGSVRAGRVTAPLPAVRASRAGRSGWRWTTISTSPAGVWRAAVRCSSGTQRSAPVRLTIRLRPRFANPSGYIGDIATLRAVAGTFIGQGGYVPSGWASRGTPVFPQTQYIADRATIANECGDNSLLLFRVRGSGESYGSDKLGGWAYTLGLQAIRKGWRVRDIQAIYTAPPVPIPDGPGKWLLTGAAFASAPFVTSGTLAARLKAFRDVATRESPSVRRDLIELYRLCPQRWIAVSGYSQGGIVLRYVIPQLPPEVRNRIISVDLVSDPTADSSVDGALSVGVSGAPENRRVEAGIDTFAARRIPGWTGQTPYPADIAPRVRHFCVEDDLVCDTAAGGGVTTVANQLKSIGSIHGGYPMAAYGVITARQLADQTQRRAPQQPTTPTQSGRPSLRIVGSCTPAGGTLRNVSSGFTPAGQTRIRAWYPDGRPYTALTTSGVVRADGSNGWQWPCQGDPSGTYYTEVVDVASGVTTGRVPFVISAESAPPPNPEVTLLVHNKVTNGPTAMREDTPAYLSTVAQNSCRSNGCAVGGTDRNTGGTYAPAVCQTSGARTTNGNDGSSSDDGNPGLYTSSRWYGVRLASGSLGYISEVWIDPSQRGGAGLPAC